MAADQTRKFVAVLPQICGGGIERICQTAVGIMWQFARKHQLEFNVFSLSDAGGVIHPNGVPEPLKFTGFNGNKLRCAWSVIRLAPRARILFLGHPYLAPLGFIARVLNPSLRYGVMAHGIEVWQLLSPVRRRALRYASLVLAPSRYTAEKIVWLQQVPKNRVTVVPHGIEASTRHGSDPHPPNHKGPVLLSVARMESGERYKGIEAVMRSLRPVVQQVPDLTYFIVGDGDDRPRMEALARECRLEGSVIFTGRIPDAELWERYANCDIFILPSTGEGFGIVFVEAMSFGKPVIASRMGAAPEVITDGVNGFLVDGQNEESLSERILQLVTDDALRQRMGQAAERTFEDNYSLHKYRSRFTDFLEALAF